MRANLHSIITVGRLRSVQHETEEEPYKNPDYLAHVFVRDAFDGGGWRAPWWRKTHELVTNPFYNYLLLRTRYYDDVFVKAVADGARQIVLLGSGTDTRPYRFRDALVQRGVRVIECDQPAVILEKASDAEKLGGCSHIHFSRLDLHLNSPEEWARDAGYVATDRTLIVAEGVTPYLLEEFFHRWLRFFSESSAPGTALVCDYKLAGQDDDFGRLGDRNTMRVSADSASVIEMHRALGWEPREIHAATDLQQKYHGPSTSESRPVFMEDIIVLAARAEGAR